LTVTEADRRCPRFCDSCRKLYGKKCKLKNDNPSPTKDSIACDAYDEMLLGYDDEQQNKNSSNDELHYCGACMKLNWKSCKFKDDPASPTTDSVACPAFAEKPPLKCGDCVAFHSPFCSFSCDDLPSTMVRVTDHACTRYFARPYKSPPKARNETVAFRRFNRKVENL